MNILKVATGLLLLMAFWRYVFMWDMPLLLRYLLNYSQLNQVQETNWFISEHLDSEDEENFQEFFNTLQRATLASQIVVTNDRQSIKIARTSSKTNCLGLVMTTSPEDPIMRVHNGALQERHFYVNFVILVKPLKRFAVAHRLLRHLYENSFHHSYLYVSYSNGSSALLSFRPHPKFIVTRVEMDSNSSPLEASYERLNCYGLEVYTPLALDLPVVFWYFDKQNRVEKHGSAFRVLNSFAEYINATLEIYQGPSEILPSVVVNMKDTLEMIRSKEILVTAHAYALFDTDERLGKSYPLLMVQWCLMVPIRNTVSTFYYPVEPFGKYVWLMLLYTYTALALVDGLWIVWESYKNPQLSRNLMSHVIASVMDNFCYLLSITASKNIKQPSFIKFVLYTTVFFHGFFVSAGYTSLLGSILAVTLFRENINTIEDLVKANISTMIIDYELEFLLAQNFDLPSNFLKLIIAVDPTTFHQHQSTFNQSYAYFVTDDKWKFLDLQQTSLKPGLFKLTEICFGTYHLVFPISMDSPAQHDLEYFIHYVHASGLLSYYRELSFGYAICAGYMQHFKPHKDYQAAGLSHLLVVFLLLMMIYVVAVLIFFSEHLHYRLNKKKSKK